MVRTIVLVIIIGLMLAFAALAVFVSSGFWWALGIVVPFAIWALYDVSQTTYSITRNFPILGHGRFWAEWLRPKLYQYFIEPDTEGKPFSRLMRNIVYQRSKDESDTSPFGTQLDVYADGYEWMNHSIAALDHHDIDSDPRVLIGGPDCLQPYSCSIFNVSAMSFGSLSKNAIMALNGGAAIGGFAHNTGEGGISPYHDKFNGDLIYQVGTGYFGCRSKDGGFDPQLFKKRTANDNVKMIELKLSQGAKPGHGGILPAGKVTKEIAEIRNIEMGKDVNSPPYHKAFKDPIGLLNFIKQMRDLSGGKPIGFKLCVGHKSEFIAICKAMIHTGIKPDFISVDGGEGGTGAAPLEFSNSVGTPYKDGLAFVYNCLIGFDLKKDISIITSGKIVTGFHIFRAISLGADVCYSARAMMMALGCIQALECNRNTCPVGVATQKSSLVKGLDVTDKKARVANFHKETVQNFVELLAAAGLDDPDKINRSHIYKRIIMNTNERYDDVFPYISKGCLLDEKSVPKSMKGDFSLANIYSFLPKFEQVYTE